MGRRNRVGVACVLLVVIGLLQGGAAQARAKAVLLLGTAVGEVTTTTAIVWGRCLQAGMLAVRARPDSGGDERVARVTVTPSRDFTGRVRLEGLQAATGYEYAAVCEDFSTHAVEEPQRGRFRTAPLDDAPQPVRLAWSGDLGGQNVCRDAQVGYDIFDRIRERKPDFFVALGDMIYADSPCKPVGLYGNQQVPGLAAPATQLEELWAAWKYNRSDRAFARFLVEVPIFPVWDDHEIVDDAGPRHDTPRGAAAPHLLPVALQAFLDYQPVLPPARAPTQLYRRRRWGRHLELFLLDTRQYRDANDRGDAPDQPKTLLGEAQRDWLLAALRESAATWKVVVSSVPLAVPTGSEQKGRDGWANFGGPTGFEQELLGILHALRDQATRNMIWLTTDVHFATGFSYTPFPDAPGFTFEELITGPLNAGMFPKNDLDDTLGGRRLFQYGPPKPAELSSFAEAKQWFNFGVLDIDQSGALTVRVVNGTGGIVYEQLLAPR